MHNLFLEKVFSQKFSSLFLALGLHLCLAFGFVLNGQNDAQTSMQMVRVNFVAPSFDSGISAKNVKILQENGEKSGENHGKKQQTSGIENENASDLSSAITDPIFDAEYLNNPTPTYPLSAKKDGIEGKVFLLVNVLPNGTAKTVDVSQSSGSSLLDGSAILAVKNWKFVPAKRFGKAIESKVIVPIEFKLS